MLVQQGLLPTQDLILNFVFDLRLLLLTTVEMKAYWERQSEAAEEPDKDDLLWSVGMRQSAADMKSEIFNSRLRIVKEEHHSADKDQPSSTGKDKLFLSIYDCIPKRKVSVL